MTNETKPRVGAIGWIVTLFFLAIPLVREIRRYQVVRERQAASDARFEERVAESNGRRQAASADGRTLDTQRCIARALPGCSGQSTCDVCADALVGCLETARRDEAYCATVPRYTAASIADSEGWRTAQREQAQLTDWTCAAMFKFVQLHCHPMRP
jgi:hypothetical protein